MLNVGIYFVPKNLMSRTIEKLSTYLGGTGLLWPIFSTKLISKTCKTFCSFSIISFEDGQNMEVFNLHDESILKKIVQNRIGNGQGQYHHWRSVSEALSFSELR